MIYPYPIFIMPVRRQKNPASACTPRQDLYFKFSITYCGKTMLMHLPFCT